MEMCSCRTSPVREWLRSRSRRVWTGLGVGPRRGAGRIRPEPGREALAARWNAYESVPLVRLDRRVAARASSATLRPTQWRWSETARTAAGSSRAAALAVRALECCRLKQRLVVGRVGPTLRGSLLASCRHARSLERGVRLRPRQPRRLQAPPPEQHAGSGPLSKATCPPRVGLSE